MTIRSITLCAFIASTTFTSFAEAQVRTRASDQMRAIAAANENGAFEWAYYSYVAPNPFDTSLALIYGVPETDASQMIAECYIGNSGPYTSVQIAADIGALPENAAVDVSFYSDSGYIHTVPGAVVGRNREEGFVGVELALGTDDYFWAGIQQESALRYAVAGEAEATIRLHASSQPTVQFLSDCANIGDLVAEDMSPTIDDPTYTCNGLGVLRSESGDQPLTMVFYNQTDGYRAIYWLDYNGDPVEYGGINPGESFTINTALTHPWMMTDGPGNCHEIILPQAGQTDYMISVPNQYFGNE